MGRTLTTADAVRYSWQLAGQWDRIKEGKAISLDGALRGGWALCRVKSVSFTKQRRKVGDQWTEVPGWSLNLAAMTGELAGREIPYFLQQASAIKAFFGFSRFLRSRRSRHANKDHEYAFENAREFFNLLVWVKVDTNRTTSERVVFKSIVGTDYTMTKNREILTQRKRISFPCVMQKTPDELPCLRCPAGLDRCSAACRNESLVSCACSRCGAKTYARATADKTKIRCETCERS